jgi:hypothetical protein
MKGASLVLVLVLGACSGDSAATPDARVNPPQPDAAPVCDTIVQDCANHGSVATPKCSLAFTASGDLIPQCVLLNDTLAVGATCTRIGGAVGNDDCNIGLYCSGLTFATNPNGTPTTRVCRRFCRDDSLCAPGEHCIAVGNGTPQDGLCIPSGCALFSTTCGTDFTCDIAALADRKNFVGLCRSVGTTAVGSDCTQSVCVAGSTCAIDTGGRTASCHADCDATHPCTGNQTCKVLMGLPNSGGTCM